MRTRTYLYALPAALLLLAGCSDDPDVPDAPEPPAAEDEEADDADADDDPAADDGAEDDPVAGDGAEDDPVTGIIAGVLTVAGASYDATEMFRCDPFDIDEGVVEDPTVALLMADDAPVERVTVALYDPYEPALVLASGGDGLFGDGATAATERVEDPLDTLDVIDGRIVGDINLQPLSGGETLLATLDIPVPDEFDDDRCVEILQSHD